MSSRRPPFLSAGKPALVSAECLAFDRESISVGHDVKNQINNRRPGCFIVRVLD
jgi:hypothetical protein